MSSLLLLVAGPNHSPAMSLKPTQSFDGYENADMMYSLTHSSNGKAIFYHEINHELEHWPEIVNASKNNGGIFTVAVLSIRYQQLYVNYIEFQSSCFGSRQTSPPPPTPPKRKPFTLKNQRYKRVQNMCV